MSQDKSIVTIFYAGPSRPYLRIPFSMLLDADKVQFANPDNGDILYARCAWCQRNAVGKGHPNKRYNWEQVWLDDVQQARQKWIIVNMCDPCMERWESKEIKGLAIVDEGMSGQILVPLDCWMRGND